jgi:hypothetical protein
MPSAIVNRMRALRMGDGEAPTSVKSYRAQMNARLMAQDKAGPQAIQRTRPRRWRAPGSPLSSDDGDYFEPERLMARQASEDRQNQREQELLDEYDESQGFPPSSPESELDVEPETDEQRAERMHQSQYERQDTPRPESPRVDEEATESARQAGEREMWANWAHMHVEHYRAGTMTWEELVDELDRDGPQ